MTAIGISKKFLKVLAFIVGALLIIFFSFQVWLNHHAESLIEKLVETQSNGKLALKVEKIKFNWMSRKIELQKAVFFSTDSSTAPVAYRFGVDRLRIELKAIIPVIFEKRIMIDSIRLVNPSINVIKRRAVRDSSTSDSTLSIPQEMGRVYHSIQDALKLLEVGRFQIDNGRFSLIDATRPGEEPVTITRISLRIDNIKVDGDNDTQEKILFSDNIMLHTSEQDINFPDGRHRLSFREFRINTQNQRVEFDSCTIVATKGDSAKSSFRVFFDRLVMTNIDFDTLYHAELIKADSVYCINPQFRLDVDLAKRTGPVQPPKLNELIQQLTGDMELATVVVEDGSFDINTMREGRPSSFTSYHNNFEMQGLRIRKNDPRPLTVERFAMAIRNFENFLRDSTYAIQFDSILFRDNRISLSNFSYAESKAGKVENYIEMPQFELHGLSWDELVFQQQLKA